MNNSKIAMDNVSLLDDEQIDLTSMFGQREKELFEVLEALKNVSSSNYWKVLENIFTKEFESLQKNLRNEKNPTEIYRLQGRLEQAEKLDLKKRIQACQQELKNIRSKLDGN